MTLYSRKITADQLRPGMFVEALDRPWIETDFLLEGVDLKTQEDVDHLRNLCEYVYISSTEPPPPEENDAAESDLPKSPANNREPRSFKEELVTARVIHEETKLLVDTMHADILKGEHKVNTEAVEEVVDQMMDSVSRHPDALVWFTNLKNRDEYTALHSMNVCMLAVTLATFVGASESSIKEMGVGALLHDVGKLKVPLEVLNKPGKLTDDEFAIMKKHPEFGVEILRDSPDLTPASIEVVRDHHERLNGSGYPSGLTGNAISYYSQLVSIADVYDAMTSDRVYQKGRAPAEALKLMLGFEGEFNDDLLKEFVRCIGDYPAGSMVELNTGEVGFVVPTGERQEKPTVLLALDYKKRRYYPQRVRDLMRFPKFDVARVLAPGSYGVNVNDYAEHWD